MKFTREQKKDAYEKLPPEVQSFIMDSETTDLIGVILNEQGLNEDQSNLADTEILCAMYGLQNIDLAIKNIAQITRKPENDLMTLKQKLSNSIFSKIVNLTQKGSEGFDLVEISSIVSQIAQKYSLNQQQQDVVLQIIKDHFEDGGIVGVENELTERLDISKLLSEQVVIDLNKRIFEQRSKTKKVEMEGSISKNEKLMSSGTQLELRPENLPAIEENEPLRVNPASTQPQKPVFQNDVLDKQIPIGVPRYAETPATPPVTNPILEKKLGGVGNNTAPIKYEKDPYREPLN